MENPQQKRRHPFEWYTQLTIGKQYGGFSFLHNNTSDLNENLSKKVQTKCYVVFFCLLELNEVTLLTCVQPRPFPISKIFLLRGGSGCTQAIALWDCRRVFSRHSTQPNNFHVLVSFVTGDNMITLMREKNTRLDGLRGITSQADVRSIRSSSRVLQMKVILLTIRWEILYAQTWQRQLPLKEYGCSHM